MRLGMNLTYANPSPALRRWTPGRLLHGSAGFWAGGFNPAAGRIWQDSAGTLAALLPGAPIGRAASASGSMALLQASNASRPALTRWPKGGRRNLALQTEDVRLWTAVNVTMPNATDVIETSANSEHRADHRDLLYFQSGKSFTASVEVKPMGTRVFRLAFAASSFPAASRAAVFNPTSGTVISSDVGTTASISAAADGFWRCRLTATANATALGHLYCGICAWNGPTATLSYAGDGSSGLKMQRIQIEEAAAASAYQQVKAAQDIAQSGLPPIWHLWDDGNDALPLTLPAGGYGIASVDHLGSVTIAAGTSNGSTPIDAMVGTHMADVILRSGAFSGGESAALTSYWQAAYLP